MPENYWFKQTASQPLYPDLLWSRPEHKSKAGKLLIIGGNTHGFAAAGEAYSEAISSGVGTARVLLPDVLQKTIGKVFAAGEYAPSTPSGSFSRQALSEALELSSWADATLLAGDFGRNSETAILLEQLSAKYNGPLVITKDALDYFTKHPQSVLDRPNTALIASFAQLQKIAVSTRFTSAFTFDMDLLRLVDLLHEFTHLHAAAMMVKHLDNLFVAHEGQVSTTKVGDGLANWRVKTAARAGVWWLQNPTNVFQAITSSLVIANTPLQR